MLRILGICVIMPAEFKCYSHCSRVLWDISKGSGLYIYPSQWQSGKITACHPKGLRFDSRMGHLGCGHYVGRSCTLSCFHSYPRLKLTFTIIAMQKSRSHPPFILYEDCLTM